jgi:hypothetical protein
MIGLRWPMGLARLVAVGAVVAGVLGGCSVEQGGAGADCVRSAECAMGLVCIEGLCSSDLSAIDDPGEVPELMPEGGMEMMVEPDASGLMTPGDAAALPADGG